MPVRPATRVEDAEKVPRPAVTGQYALHRVRSSLEALPFEVAQKRSRWPASTSRDCRIAPVSVASMTAMPDREAWMSTCPIRRQPPCGLPFDADGIPNGEFEGAALDLDRYPMPSGALS